MRLALILLLWCGLAAAQVNAPSARPISPLEEQRYCGEPARNADGTIKRSSAVIAAFRRAHPCPVTGLTSGACPGWSIDHTLPLACGGCDAVSNMQWLPNAIKSGAGTLPKDRWERIVYCSPPGRVP